MLRFLAWSTLTLLSGFCAAEELPAGVVVEKVGRGSVLREAGLRAGDLLVSWTRSEEASGRFDSPFDWRHFVVEQAPRGPVELVGRRRGAPIRWLVPVGWYEAAARPRMPAGILEDYLAGREQIESGQLERGVALWERAAAKAGDRKLDLVHAWLRLEIGDAWKEAKRWREARAAYSPEPGARPEVRVLAHNAFGAVAQSQRDLAAAEESYRAALELRRALWGPGLSVAESRGRLAIAIFYGGRRDEAVDLLTKVLAAREELAPGSPAVIETLADLAFTAWTGREPERALEYARRALATGSRQAKRSPAMMTTLNILGILARHRGDLKRAETRYREALKLGEELTDGRLDETTATLHNLGIVTRLRGDLEASEDFHLRALRDRQEQGNPFAVADSRRILGGLLFSRGELERAAEYYAGALEYFEEHASGSMRHADVLLNLSTVAARRGELERATELATRGYGLFRQQAGNSAGVARGLLHLGRLAEQRGELEAAQAHLEEAVEILRQQSPTNLNLAVSLNSLGLVARRQGDLERAERAHREALAILEQVYGDVGQTAAGHYLLALVRRDRGDPDSALRHLERSVAVLEAQTLRLGGSQDARGVFRTRHRSYYQTLVELLVERDRREEAFAVLERSRAQGFLEMLAERDLLFSSDIPQELEAERRRLHVLHDRTQGRMARLDPAGDGARIERLARELQELRRQHRGVAAEVRRASARLAELQYPNPLGLAEARQALDPGTVLLSYSVGEEATVLFVASREGALEVHPIALGEAGLRREVELFRQLLPQAVPGSETGPGAAAALDGAGRRLYRLLVEPAAERVAASERVLLVPDGPLHVLPFAALLRETATERQYLVEWKPLHSALSATVYAQLRRERRGAGGAPLRLAAFGDPYFSRELAGTAREEIADVRLRAALDRGFDFAPLPASRREAEGIAALYPAEERELYLGRDATEERARAVGRTAGSLHFATHAFVDQRFPLNSGLVLSIPEELGEGRENGVLQVWEIFEGVRLNADLVVLSACESALGQEEGGEGLIGLTRAFQYAGARSVAASLWKVDDDVTAELMVRFYRHMRAGRPKDEALRAAQLELIRGSIAVPAEGGHVREVDASAPYYWAAFQIYGDWR